LAVYLRSAEPYPGYGDPELHPVCDECGTPHELDDPRGKGRETDFEWMQACSCPYEPWVTGHNFGGCVPYGTDYQSENGCVVCDLERQPVAHPWAVRYRFDRSDRCPQHKVTLQEFGGAT
jgi:hypothetical protein